MEHFSAVPQTNINSNTPSRQCHAVFHYFLSNDSKQDAATITSHRKHLISFLKDKKLMTTSLMKIWENTDGCAKKYRCASALYLMSVMLKSYSIIIDWGISAPGHGKKVVYGLNAVYKCYIYKWMSTVQLPGSIRFDYQMKMHTGTKKDEVNLAKEFQEHLTKKHQKCGVIDQGK